MKEEKKKKYFDMAHHEDREHRQRYPGKRFASILVPYPVNNAHK
jgi:hypothetical protein